ncbi:ABC transporter ATP-binding protein [Nocardioides panacis]|uniref:ABC transporter ATP-binding protein n=1 Tax=Nocardioides panacis TaxID=2849501 RepID=A0A975Y0G7_9ACTN|nr:ABC transporter ATP-binding protein [Nocardioides panacis]QWZ08435.1 ABC transporter ATP-binding protein [Nocardioides panacis]
MSPYLDAHVVVRRPGHTLDVRLTAERGDVVAVIGPNGAGKSTLVRALAGVVPLDDGRVVCDGETWDAPATRTEIRSRGIGMVFQKEMLFPHLTALGNVAFGPRSRGVRRRAAEERALAWLARLGVEDLAGRRPAQLSGGQAQRVAIARALVTEPRLLLLDEPLSSLDVGVAMALRLELSRHLADFDGVSLLVTHDALDAMTVANRVLVIDDGRVAQDGTPAEVARQPATDHVARLVGLNVLRGTSAGTSIRLADGTTLVSTTPARGEVRACFSPSAVTLTVGEPHGSARNRWPGRVTSVAPHGSAVRVHVDAAAGLIADVTPASASQLGVVPGAEVWATVKATEVSVYGGQ